tara:strand:- start:1204 stop:3468 length:2265 start_codon:yes stop_codon:yes gene_type:complete
MDDWLKCMGNAIPLQDLKVTLATEFRDYVGRHADGVVRLISAVRHPQAHELIVFELETGRPQRPVYPLRRKETICVLFQVDGNSPSVFALRDDFPDTLHQNIVPEGVPCCICVDDRPWQEAKSTYTGSELLYRIRRWFERAGLGQLHDIGQPLDPFFAGSLLNVVLPSFMFSAEGVQASEMIAHSPNEEHSNVLILKPATAQLREESKGKGTTLFLNFETTETEMGRIRKAPENLLDLCSDMKKRGLDLLQEIREICYRWADDEDHDASFRLNARFGILVRMPIVHPATKEVHGSKPSGFICLATVGEIGVASGMLFKDTSRTGQKSGYTRSINPGDADEASLARIEVGMVAVHREFDRELATNLAGRESVDTRRIVMVGAGAVGSMVSETLHREGRFSWTIIDHDVLLPHNMERHILHQYDIGRFKSKAVLERLNTIRNDAAATTLEADVLNEGDLSDSVNTAFQSADIILDASASAVVARNLCDRSAEGRRACIFFNPAGDTAILMIEDSERKSDLRHIEAQYYRETLNRPELRKHLSQSVEQIPYAGSCRAVTNRMPYSRASLLSSLLASGLSEGLDQKEASLSVWSVKVSGSVDAIKLQANEPTCHGIGDWKICIDPALESKILTMREERLNNETGGILLGVIDRIANRIDLVEAWAQPEDSVGKPSEFRRGIKRLIPDIKQACEATLDQIRYVGEWHSHPRGCKTDPSQIDLAQIIWLTDELAVDGCPSLMIIAGDEGLTFLVGKFSNQ